MRAERRSGVTGSGGLALRIPSACFFGLIGPNGSGKTTIGMVCGLVRAPAGRLFVFGNDAVIEAARARLLTSVAPQEVHLDRFLTVRDVLVYHGRYFGLDRVTLLVSLTLVTVPTALVRSGWRLRP